MQTTRNVNGYKVGIGEVTFRIRAYVRTGVRAEEATLLLYVRTSMMLHCTVTFKIYN